MSWGRIFPTKTGEYPRLVYTTQVNSTFRARWLASSDVISQALFTSEQPTKNKNGLRRYIVTNTAALWAAGYSARVVYTKTIIHLSVGESGEYLPRRGGSANIHHYSPPLRRIIVNNNNNNNSPKWRWIVVDICRAAKRRGKYSPLSPTLRWIIIVLVYTTQAE